MFRRLYQSHDEAKPPYNVVGKSHSLQYVILYFFVSPLQAYVAAFTPGISWYSFLEAESTPGTWTCRILLKKSPVTRPGIDSETSRLVR